MLESVRFDHDMLKQTTAEYFAHPLQEQARVSVEAYFIATQDAALWVGAPKKENIQAALETLRRARELRKELEASRWLEGER